MPTTASRASPTSGRGRPVRPGAAVTVGSSGGSAMRRCGRSASRRAFSRGSRRARSVVAPWPPWPPGPPGAGTGWGRGADGSAAALAAPAGWRCATARTHLGLRVGAGGACCRRRLRPSRTPWARHRWGRGHRRRRRSAPLLGVVRAALEDTALDLAAFFVGFLGSSWRRRRGRRAGVIRGGVSSARTTGSAPMSGVERRLARSPDARAAPAARAPWRAAISDPSRSEGAQHGLAWRCRATPLDGVATAAAAGTAGPTVRAKSSKARAR